MVLAFMKAASKAGRAAGVCARAAPANRNMIARIPIRRVFRASVGSSFVTEPTHRPDTIDRQPFMTLPLALILAAASMAAAADLQVYAIDVEGVKSTLFVSP